MPGGPRPGSWCNVAPTREMLHKNARAALAERPVVSLESVRTGARLTRIGGGGYIAAEPVRAPTGRQPADRLPSQRGPIARRLNRLVRHCHEFNAAAVAAEAPAPAIDAIRRKGVSDKLHSMVILSVKRER
jgi:hypothetical protein